MPGSKLPMHSKNLLNNTIWLFFIFFSALLLVYFINEPRIHYGGDIIEYFGMTESLKNHIGLHLTSQDQANIEKRLGPGYLQNPEYYLRAVDGQRRAVHFPLYSILMTPVRLTLESLNIDPYKSFRISNLLILTAVNVLILWYFLKNWYQRIIYLICIYSSPFLWFLIWPGPELFSITLILLSLFLFFNKYRALAVITAAAASNQSQPLAIIPIVYVLVVMWENWDWNPHNFIRKNHKILTAALTIFIPNLYYLIIFHTPFSHGRLEGVGFQNFSLTRLFELYFDLNQGLAIYMPIIFILGLIYLFKNLVSKPKNIWVLVLLFILSCFYLTNNNWNSGTAGYGPIRYGLPTIPFLIFFLVSGIKNKYLWIIAGLILLSQLPVLALNNFLMPTLENDKRHTPLAKFVLNYYPKLYSPTPEIFIERTNETEGGIYNTTVYMHRGICTKAYVLNNNYQPLIDNCGRIPTKYFDRIRSSDPEGFYIEY